MRHFKQLFFLAMLCFCVTPLFSREAILEFKGAYLLSVDELFRECYKGSALYGPELSVQLKNDKNWYAFAGVDYFQQKGRCLSRCDSTKLKLLPITVGIKYCIPLCHRAHFYFGLGLQSAFIRTTSRRSCVVGKRKQWGFGGIGKMGAYIDLSHNFLLDLFFDYSFIRTDNLYGPTVASCRSSLHAALFGAGLGYRFN